MTVHVHRLKGCRPTPLAHYLKALGVLRLFGEQADASARAFWKDDVFHLVTTLGASEIETFLLETYAPTPMIGPWNGGSGFYEGDAIEGREAIRLSSGPRFAPYRQAIEAVLAWPELPATGLTLSALCDRVTAIADKKKGKARESLLSLLRDVTDALSDASQTERARLLQLSIQDVESRATKKGLAKSEAARLKALAKAAKKVRSQFKSAERSAGKEELALAARRRLPDASVRWLDAALVITADGELRYPPLFGSGGNEGRLDYTTAFADALKRAIVTPDANAPAWLRTALWATPSEGFVVASVGQFDPGRAGGFNQGPELETKGVPTNPWDYILSLEGAVVWSSSATRIGRVEGASGLSSPFTVQLKAVGYGSSALSDEESARAEVWAPLWQRPVTQPELAAFIAESRARVGRRTTRSFESRPVRSTTEFAEAASTLGVCRGIAEFVRFSLLRRRGDSFIALPSGRFGVRGNDDADLIRELAQILDEVDAFIRGFGEAGPPRALSSLRQRLDAAVFRALAQPSRAAMQEIICAVGDLEQFFALRDRSKKPSLNRPLLGLHPRWLLAADDGTIELRVAASLASIQACGRVGTLRANLTGVDPEKPWAWTAGRGQVAWSGPTPPHRLVSVLRQRMMDADRLGAPTIPTGGLLSLAPGDIVSFVHGEADDGRIERLLFGLTLVDWRRDRNGHARKELKDQWSRAIRPTFVPGPWALLKLLFWPGGLELDNEAATVVVAEPSIPSLLLANRVDEACRVARRRLFASGLTPVDVAWPRQTGLDPVRLAASLLIPCRSLSTLTRSVLNAPAER